MTTDLMRSDRMTIDLLTESHASPLDSKFT